MAHTSLPDGVYQKLAALASEGKSVASNLEKGQAETPLTDKFYESEKSLKNSFLNICLTGFNERLINKCLGWLSGHNYSHFSIKTTQKVGLYEIKLNSKCFLLQTAEGTIKEFEQLEQFMDALKNCSLVDSQKKSDWLKPVELSLAAPSGAQPLKILVPESLEKIAESPALLTYLTKETTVLMIVIDSDCSITQSQRDILCDLAESMMVVCPVYFSSYSISDSNINKKLNRVFEDRRSFISLSPVIIKQNEKTDLPDFIINKDNNLRQLLIQCSFSQKLNSALESVDARLKYDLKQLQLRSSSIERKQIVKQKNLEAIDIRSLANELKDYIQKNYAQLLAAVEENNRKAMLDEGDLIAPVINLIESIEAANLHSAKTPTKIRLSLDPTVSDKIQQVENNCVKKRLHEDIELISEGVQAMSEELNEKIQNHYEQARTLCAVAPQASDIWDIVKDCLNMKIKYSGEMQKRGFFQRLMAGKRLVFSVTMLLSLAGLGLSKSNPYFLLLLVLPLFTGGIVYSYIHWEKEDEERLEKELERVKSEIEKETRKIIAESQREKYSRIRNSLEESKKSLLKTLDDVISEFASLISQELLVSRNDLSSKIKSISVQFNQTKDIQKKLNGILQKNYSLKSELRHALVKQTDE